MSRSIPDTYHDPIVEYRMSPRRRGNRVLLWSEIVFLSRSFYWYDFDRRRVVITWASRDAEVELPPSVPLPFYRDTIGGIMHRNMLKPSSS